MKDQLNQTLEYWIRLTECYCFSERAIGGCLHCDLKQTLLHINDLFEQLQATKAIFSELEK